MKWEIGHITVDYDEDEGTVAVADAPLQREEVFKLMSVLRSVYNHAGRRQQQAAEDAALRSLGLDRLHRIPRRE